jgi:hypothetical protein
LVSRFEAPDVRIDANDHPCNVVPQDEGRSIGQDQLELTVANLRIQLVQAGRVDFDQNVVRSRFRHRQLAKTQRAFLLVSIENESLHNDPLR